MTPFRFVRILKPGGKIVFSYLEFAEPAHWSVFINTKSSTHATKSDHLNMFIERSVIDVWAAKLDIAVEKHISALTPTWNGHALGQSVAVLRKPAQGTVASDL